MKDRHKPVLFKAGKSLKLNVLMFIFIRHDLTAVRGLKLPPPTELEKVCPLVFR